MVSLQTPTVPDAISEGHLINPKAVEVTVVVRVEVPSNHSNVVCQVGEPSKVLIREIITKPPLIRVLNPSLLVCMQTVSKPTMASPIIYAPTQLCTHRRKIDIEHKQVGKIVFYNTKSSTEEGQLLTNRSRKRNECFHYFISN